jgi:hypothetical protein
MRSGSREQYPAMRHLSVAIIALLAASAVGCSSPDTSRCVPARTTLLDAIATGLTVSGGSLTGGQAVRSTDFSRVWFVAAKIHATGVDDVGVWATNTDPSVSSEGEVGSIFAVDGFAKEFTDWGPAPNGISMSDDGAEIAQACAG